MTSIFVQTKNAQYAVMTNFLIFEVLGGALLFLAFTALVTGITKYKACPLCAADQRPVSDLCPCVARTYSGIRDGP